MSFQTLSERLAALQESNTRLQGLIRRLCDTKCQPGSLPLESDEDDVMAELGAEIQQTLREQEDDFEILLEETASLDAGRAGGELEEQKAGLEGVVHAAVADLKRMQGEYRKAHLAALQNAAAARREERRLLLLNYDASPGGDPSPTLHHRPHTSRQARELTQDEKTLHASSDVTLALRRTHDMMAGELSRSQFVHETLRESTAALARLGENYSRLDTVLASSRNLLSTLISSQKSDTWYLETAFMILCATIGWLVFRRFIYGPAWWLLWVPIKIVFKTTSGAVALSGIARNGIDAANMIDLSSSVVSSSILSAEQSSRKLAHQTGSGIIEDVGKIIDAGETKKASRAEQGFDGSRASTEEHLDAANAKRIREDTERLQHDIVQDETVPDMPHKDEL